MSKKAILVINFGGPRDLNEVPDFLEALLTDEDVIRTPFPPFFQNWFFRRIARKRSKKVAGDYASIGGKSPIFEDTEWVAAALGKELEMSSLAFHRYLRSTHAEFLEKLEKMDADEIWVFPLFPQFSYATTGSIARWMKKHVSPSIVKKMKWISSYAAHEKYIEVFAENIRNFLEEKQLNEEETVLLFSAHGLPKKFIEEGDPYQKECEQSFHLMAEKFSKAKVLLSYQSKFGRGEWIQPSTLDRCFQVKEWIEDRKQVVFIPLSFTSDHIETLFEIEEEYIAPLKEMGYKAYRSPALGRREDWIQAICSIVKEGDKIEGGKLIRNR